MPYDILESESQGYDVLEPEELGPSFQPATSVAELSARAVTPPAAPGESADKYHSELIRLSQRLPDEETQQQLIALTEEAMQKPIASIPRPLLKAAVLAGFSPARGNEDMAEGLTDALQGMTTLTPELVQTLPAFSIPVFGQALAMGLGAKGVGTGAGEAWAALKQKDVRGVARGVGSATLMAPMLAPLIPHTPIPEIVQRWSSKTAVPPIIPKVPDALQIRQTTPVLQNVRTQPGEGAGRVPAAQGAPGVQRGVQTSQGAGRPEVPLTPAVQISSVTRMSGTEFNEWARGQTGGFTTTADRLGDSITTPEELAALKEAWDAARQRGEELTKGDLSTDAAIEEAQGAGYKEQFFSEAYGRATGTGSAGEYAAKNVPGYTPKFPPKPAAVSKASTRAFWDRIAKSTPQEKLQAVAQLAARALGSWTKDMMWAAMEIRQNQEFQSYNPSAWKVLYDRITNEHRARENAAPILSQTADMPEVFQRLAKGEATVPLEGLFLAPKELPPSPTPSTPPPAPTIPLPSEPPLSVSRAAQIEALAQKAANPKAGRFTKEENALLGALSPEERAAYLQRAAVLKGQKPPEAPAPVSPAVPVSPPAEKAAPAAPAAPAVPKPSIKDELASLENQLVYLNDRLFDMRHGKIRGVTRKGLDAMEKNIAETQAKYDKLRAQAETPTPTATAPSSPASADPISTLASAPAVKVTLPPEARVLPGKGTPAVEGVDAKGRTAVQPASVFAKGNPFRGAGITKIRPGYIDKATKKFVPVKGKVEVSLPAPKVPRTKLTAKAKAAIRKLTEPAAPVPVTPAPAAAKMQAEVTKTADVQGAPSAKAVKKTLVSELDKAIETAPATADLPREQSDALTALQKATKQFPEGMVSERGSQAYADAQLAAIAAGLKPVTISIPGDGDFMTWPVKETLVALRNAAKRLSTTPAEKEPWFPPPTPRRHPESARARLHRIFSQNLKDAVEVYGSVNAAYERLWGQLARAKELDLPPDQIKRLKTFLEQLTPQVHESIVEKTRSIRQRAYDQMADLQSEAVKATGGPGAMSASQKASAGARAMQGVPPPAATPPAVIPAGDPILGRQRPLKDVNVFNGINSPQWTFWFGKLGEAAKKAWETIALGEFRIRSNVARDVKQYVQATLSSLPRAFRKRGGEVLFDILDGRTMQEIEADWQGKPGGDKVIAAAYEVKRRLEEIRSDIRDVKREKLYTVLMAMKRDALVDLFKKNVDPNIDVSTYSKDSLATAVTHVEFPDDWGIADGTYLPHMFFGEWRITAQRAGDPTAGFVMRAQTMTEATARIREFIKNNPDYAGAVWKVGQDAIIPSDMLRLGDKRFWKLVSDMKQKLTTGFDVREALQGIIGRKAAKAKWWGNLKSRQGFRNYSREFDRVMSSYLHGYHRWKVLNEVTRDVTPLIDQVRREGRTEAAKELDTILDYVWGKPAQTTIRFDNFLRQLPGVRNVVKPLALERWSRNLRMLTTLGVLRTIRFSIVNRLQPLQGLYPLVGEATMARAKLAQHTAAGRALLDEAGVRFDMGQWGVEGGTLTKLAEWRQRFTGEQSNQEIAFLAMYDLARRQGLPHQTAIKYGKLRGQLMTQFSPLKADIPPALRGPIAAVFFQFKRFPIKQAELLLKMGGSRNIPGLARWMIMTAALGGAQYFLRQFLIPTEKRKQLRDTLVEHVGEDAADYVFYGVPNLIGADISGSLTLGDEPFGQSLYEQVGRQVVGPTVSIAYETGKAARTARRVALEPSQEIETTIRRYPTLRPIAELIALTRGDVDIRSPDGEIRYRRTVRDALRGLAALRSAKESNITLYTDWMVEMAKEIQDLKNGLFVELSKKDGDVIGAMDAIGKFNARWPEFSIRPDEIHQYLQDRRTGVDKTDVERLAGRRFRSVLSELHQEEE